MHDKYCKMRNIYIYYLLNSNIKAIEKLESKIKYTLKE